MLETKKKSWKNVQKQYFTTIAVNLISIAHGVFTGWTAPILPLLMNESTPLACGPLQNEELSWIGSVNCVGGLTGSLSFGFLTTQLGAKRSLFCVSVPLIANWILIYFGNSVYHILLARFLGGFAGSGIHSSALLFVSEISNDDIRGRLGSVAPVFRNCGTLIAYILGANLSYRDIPLVSVIFPISFVVIFSMIPNSPRFFLKKGKLIKAENALKYYKGYKSRNQDDENEFRMEFERLKSIVNVQKEDQKLCFADFFNRDALKGLGIGFTLTTLSALTGTPMIIAYAVTIFQELGTQIDSYIASMLCALALIFGSIITTYLADRLGRKKLNMISLSGSAIGLICAASYHYLDKNGIDLQRFTFIPVVSLCFTLCIASAGIVPLATVCSVENLPSKIRTAGVSIILCWFALNVFTTAKTFPFLMNLLGIHGCLTIYAVGCIIGFIFILFVLQETSGKSLDHDLSLRK